jgi:NADPH2:quinone reductase
MRAVTITTFGSPDGLMVTERAEPIPAAGQLLIETHAIGVGGVDALIRRGTLGTSGAREGIIPGSEVAGRVIGVGTEIDPSWIGRRVGAFTGISGGYAERAVAALDDITPLPETLSAIDAVTLGSAGPVAHFALRHAQFAAGDSVLIRGAAGSIGIAAVQLAAAAGARAVAVTTSSRERGEQLIELGATEVLDRSGSTFGGASSASESASASGPVQFDVILDIVGGAALPAFIERLAPNGRMVVVGIVAGYPPADFGMSLMRGFQRSLSLSTFSLDTVPIVSRNALRAEQFEAAVRGELRAIVHEVLPLAEAADAHRRVDAGEVFGRFVLVP